MLPVVGLGTYALHGDACVNAVYQAVQSGYRLIDTASFYGNEREVGEGVRQSGVSRSEIFVQTKLYPNQYSHAEQAIDEALSKLDIGYIDMMLLHHPASDASDPGGKGTNGWDFLLLYPRDGCFPAKGIHEAGTDSK